MNRIISISLSTKMFSSTSNQSLLIIYRFSLSPQFVPIFLSFFHLKPVPAHFPPTFRFFQTPLGLDLHRRRRQSTQLLCHPLAHTRHHSAATRQDDVASVWFWWGLGGEMGVAWFCFPGNCFLFLGACFKM